MDTLLKEKQFGFTIVEVMLFLALSGFLLVGLLIGTGASIANQRYNDAVQDAADALRSAYSFVANTSINQRDKDTGACGSLTTAQLDNHSYMLADFNNGRGRTSCAVYGAVVTLNRSSIQTTTFIGEDYYDAINKDGASADLSDDSKSDLEIFKLLNANNLAASCEAANPDNCTISPAGTSMDRKLKWDVAFHSPRDDGGNNTEDYMGTLLIYRAPRGGAIRTYVMDDIIKKDDKPVDYSKLDDVRNPSYLDNYGIYSVLDSGKFEQKDVYLCVSSEGSLSFSNHRRILHIQRNASSQSGVILENMDEDVIDNNSNDGAKVLCDNQ